MLIICNRPGIVKMPLIVGEETGHTTKFTCIVSNRTVKFQRCYRHQGQTDKCQLSGIAVIDEMRLLVYGCIRAIELAMDGMGNHQQNILYSDQTRVEPFVKHTAAQYTDEQIANRFGALLEVQCYYY